MKKIILLLLIPLLFIGCTPKNVQRITIDGLQSIQYDQLNELMDQDVEFLLYLGREDCGDCQSFKPKLQEYIDTHENTGIYYLDIKEYRDASRKEDASQQEKDFYNNLYKRFDFDWTPTLEVISSGQVKERYQYLDEDYFEIKDREEQLKKKQEFLDDFKAFMDSYFKGES